MLLKGSECSIYGERIKKSLAFVQYLFCSLSFKGNIPLLGPVNFLEFLLEQLQFMRNLKLCAGLKLHGETNALFLVEEAWKMDLDSDSSSYSDDDSGADTGGRSKIAENQA
ncbi:unnamed protein product [Ilex paraguariensis]|uniref:Uncharacterized protein n=1 Tax=Ilex paraguariensis TaxID=185542 RepID=A0ABC8R5M6_9AQUA